MLGSPQRLASAVLVAVEHLRSGSIVETVCPASQQVGRRPAEHSHGVMGTTCEAWMVRGMQMILDHYLDPRMRGLEWSAGSGSFWALRRLHHLHSVEHDVAWAAFLQSTLREQLPHLAPKWTLAAVPCRDDTPGECAHNDGQSETPGANYTEYVGTVGTRWAAEYPFDYVLVDGRRRDECLDEVLHRQPGMLSPRYGVLVLDNSDRPYTADVPAHWLCVSLRAFARTHGRQVIVDETTLWMRCPSVDDANCATARRDIQRALGLLPARGRHAGGSNHTLGTRCPLPRR